MYANFVVGGGIASNSIFDLNHYGNRDDCFYPYWLLHEKFGVHGIELNTADINSDRSIAFELHLDVKKSDSAAPFYVLLSLHFWAGY